VRATIDIQGPDGDPLLARPAPVDRYGTYDSVNDDIKATSLTALEQFGDASLGEDKALLKSVDRFGAGDAPAKYIAKRPAVPDQIRFVRRPPMETAATTCVQSEAEFAALVDAIAGDAARQEQLTQLLREGLCRGRPASACCAATSIARCRSG
jgi:hypothetical protein